MNTQRRPRTQIKRLDALKAAAIIIGLLLSIIAVLWVGTRMMQNRELQPDLTPRPAKSLWEEPAPVR